MDSAMGSDFDTATPITSETTTPRAPARPEPGPAHAPEDLASVIDAIRHGLKLKDVKRAGWLLRDVAPADAESVAAHCWGVTLMALLLTPRELDLGRVLAVAAVHDLAEVDVGDLTPHDGVSKEEKSRREREAMKRMLAPLPEASRARLQSLWLDYEEGRTPEGRFVKQLDRLEAVFQATLYAPHAAEGLVAEFGGSAASKITRPELQAILARLMALGGPEEGGAG